MFVRTEGELPDPILTCVELININKDFLDL